MLYKYEVACKEAGLSEEKIAEIRRMFDAENKVLRRRKKARERYQVSWISIVDMAVDGKEFELEDTGTNVEAEGIRNCELEELSKYMEEMTADEREFLMISFSGERNANQLAAEKYKLTVEQARYRKQKLVKRLKDKFKV